MLGVLAKELLKAREHLVDQQRTVVADVPGPLVGDERLRRPREVARNHLAIDRVGDAHGVVARHQTEVAHVFEIVGHDRPGGPAAGQKRLDHAPHARFLQLVGQLVEVGLAAPDQLLARVLDRRRGDGPAAVPPGLAAEARLVGEGVHQPRLALGQRPDPAPRFRRERLAGLAGVLIEQRFDLPRREVAQPQRLGADVEGAAAGDDRLFRRRPDAVVAHVAHPAEDDALREAARALRVARAQLPQHREQGVADQRVDFVDQQHQRPGFRRRPPGQALLQGHVRTRRRQRRQRRFPQTFVLRRQRQRGQDGPHRPRHVLARRLADLHVHVHAAQRAGRVDRVAQRQEGGGLAGLARRAQDEVLPLPDEPQHVVDVDPRQRPDVVVPRRHDGTRRIEEAHGAAIVPDSPRPSRRRPPRFDRSWRYTS